MFSIVSLFFLGTYQLKAEDEDSTEYLLMGVIYLVNSYEDFRVSISERLRGLGTCKATAKAFLETADSAIRHKKLKKYGKLTCFHLSGGDHSVILDNSLESSF